MRDQWYSFENGENTITELDSVRMTNRGRCVDMEQESYIYTMLFRRDNCYFCVQLLVRTINVMEKRESESHAGRRMGVCM